MPLFHGFFYPQKVALKATCQTLWLTVCIHRMHDLYISLLTVCTYRTLRCVHIARTIYTYRYLWSVHIAPYDMYTSHERSIHIATYGLYISHPTMCTHCTLELYTLHAAFWCFGMYRAKNRRHSCHTTVPPLHQRPNRAVSDLTYLNISFMG